MPIREIARRDWSSHPPQVAPEYKSTTIRAPTRPLVPLAQTLSEVTGPIFGQNAVEPGDADLTTNAASSGACAQGERIIVTGRVLDDDGKPVPNTLIEIWQCNAAGRYRHDGDQHDAPLDPHFSGGGRCMTDEDGAYRFVTIRPGAYPWGNHPNAWRPAHIHFSLFGTSFVSRLVTQMYFPGDPLLALDPIFNAVVDEKARTRLVAAYDHNVTQPDWALGYRFDFVLRGSNATPMES